METIGENTNFVSNQFSTSYHIIMSFNFSWIYSQPDQIQHFPDTCATMCGHMIKSGLWNVGLIDKCNFRCSKREEVFLLLPVGNRPHWDMQTGTYFRTVEQQYIWRLVSWCCKAGLLIEGNFYLSNVQVFWFSFGATESTPWLFMIWSYGIIWWA